MKTARGQREHKRIDDIYIERESKKRELKRTTKERERERERRKESIIWGQLRLQQQRQQQQR